MMPTDCDRTIETFGCMVKEKTPVSGSISTPCSECRMEYPLTEMLRIRAHNLSKLGGRMHGLFHYLESRTFVFIREKGDDESVPDTKQ